MKTNEFPSGPRQRDTHTFFSFIYCWGKSLELKTRDRPTGPTFNPTGRGFAPRQPFLFFTRRRRRRVSIYQSYYGREETKCNRSERCNGRALAFKTIGRGFAPRQRSVFFRRRRRRRISIYQSYYGREETKCNRSERCNGRALAFKTIGRGFAPRQRFVFFRRRRRRRVSIYQSYYGREGQVGVV